jgi:hypothetical protein
MERTPVTSPKDGPRDGAKPSEQGKSLEQGKSPEQVREPAKDSTRDQSRPADPKVTGKPAEPSATASSAKPDPVKSEPVKAGPTGSSALSGSGPTGSLGRPQDAKADAPAKPGPAGSSAVPPSGTTTGPTSGKSTEPGRPSAGSASPAASGSTASGPATSGATGGSAPLKPGPTGSSAVPPNTAGTKPADAKPEAPAKAGATGSSAVRPDIPASGTAKPQDAKSQDAKSQETKSQETKPDAKSGTAQGATRVTETASLTDGPILDLKAKRLSDPAEAAKPGAKPDAGKEGTGTSASPKTSSGEVPKAAAHPARSGPGFGSVAASGLLGGLIGAGLLYGVTTYQRGADPRLAALDKSVAGLATKDAVAGLDKRLAANEQALKPLPDAVARAEAAAKAATERANEALQKAGAAPAADSSAPAPAVPADVVARLDALDQRVSALQEEPGRDGTAEVKTAPTGDPAALASLDDRIKALEASGAKSPSPDLSDKIAALQSEVASRTKADEEAKAALGRRLDEVQKALEGRIAAASQAAQEATQAGKQAADAARTRADETVQGLERKLQDKLQEQSERIASLDKAVDQSAKQTTVQSALRIVAADRIASALEAGQPYPDALASLRNLEPADSKRLDALAPFADKGAPTAAGLAAEFRRISEKIAEAKRAAQAKAVAETGNVGDRLMSMASSLVQVKRVEGPAAGGAPSAAGSESSTAQVQAALDRGDLAAAAKAYAALPEEARAQGGDFGARLSARSEAGRAAQALLADAFTGLPPAR